MSFPALIQLAQAGGGGQGSPLGVFLLLGAFMLVFYAFVIRPQQQQEKRQREMRDSLKKGDQIVTSGGLHGKITGLADDIVTVEIADRVRVKVNRAAIAGSADASGGRASSSEDKA